MADDANDRWYCREKIGPWGSAASLAIQFAPAQDRDRLLAILALEREWEEMVRSPHAHDLAAVRFSWWREEMVGRREQSTHPVVRLLIQSRALDVMPLTRLEETLGAYLELTFGRYPIHEPRGQALLGRSRGTFLHWSTLGHLAEIPRGPIESLARAIWLSDELARSGPGSLPEPSEADTEAHARPGAPRAPVGGGIYTLTRHELRTGLEGLGPLIHEPSCRLIRILATLANLTLQSIEGQDRSRHKPARAPAVTAKLWRAWQAARDEQTR